VRWSRDASSQLEKITDWQYETETVAKGSYVRSRFFDKNPQSGMGMWEPKSEDIAGYVRLFGAVLPGLSSTIRFAHVILLQACLSS
jgi:plasmid stabilization system protein ParE